MVFGFTDNLLLSLMDVRRPFNKGNNQDMHHFDESESFCGDNEEDWDASSRPIIFSFEASSMRSNRRKLFLTDETDRTEDLTEMSDDEDDYDRAESFVDFLSKRRGTEKQEKPWMQTNKTKELLVDMESMALGTSEETSVRKLKPSVASKVQSASGNAMKHLKATKPPKSPVESRRKILKAPRSLFN